MKRNFHYVMLGAGVTVLVFLGTFALLLSRAQADGAPGPVSSSPAGDLPHDVTTTTGEGASPANDDAPPSMHTPVSSNTDTTAKVAAEAQITVSAPRGQDSAGNPETDFDTIIAQVRALADKYESEMLGQAGWLHRVSDYYFPARYLSNTGMIEGRPVSEIRPQDLMRKEEWFLVDEDGNYTTSIGHDLDRQDVVRRSWAHTDGKAVFLSLSPTSEYRVQDRPSGHVSLHGDPLWNLEVAQANNQTAKAWREGNTYIVVVTIVEEEPVKLDNVGITVIRREKQWVFDLTTGALRSTKDSLQADDGTWVPGQRWTILSQEMVSQPSPEALDTLSQAEQIIQEAE